MKEVKYLELLNDLEGKPIAEIKEIIKNNDIIYNNIETMDVYEAVIDTYNKIQNANNNDNDSIKKIFINKIFVYYAILDYFTNINITSTEKTIENLNVYLEMALIELSDKIYLFNEIIKEIIIEDKFRIIKELTDVFNSGLPSVDELNSLQDSLGNMFKDETPEKLEKIESILAFNDPVMKELKNVFVNPELQEKVSDNNGGDNNS